MRLQLNQNVYDIKFTKKKQLKLEREKYELVSRGRMRKVDQPHRVVYMHSSLVTFPAERLSFVEENTFVIVRPPQSVEYEPLTSSGNSGSLLINWHRVHAQHYDVPASLARDRALDTLKQSFISDSSIRDQNHFRKLKKWLSDSDPDTI